ncbi:hypothetical protein V5O48_009879 [Marasmius crinis-equi]|uniref:Uncharacterized protein n=1 Tax=Marasmius crinis-equi TaxID=585013 RepID=A0ABR3FA29_9AGAR
MAARSLTRISRVFNHTPRLVLPTRQPGLPLAAQQVRRLTQQRSGNDPVDKPGDQNAPPGRRGSILEQMNTALDQMGATRGVKITIVIFLSIVGTLETMFYVKAAHRWLYPTGEEEVANDEK